MAGDRKKHDGTIPPDEDLSDWGHETPVSWAEFEESPLPALLEDLKTLDPEEYGSRALQLLERAAFADLGEYAAWGKRGLVLKASDELTRIQRLLIEEVKEDKDGNVSIKLVSKSMALRLLAQASGILKDPQSGMGDALSELAEVLRGIDGKTRGLPPRMKTINQDGTITDED